MMDLEEEHRHAIAALFALALRLSEVPPNGADDLGRQPAAIVDTSDRGDDIQQNVGTTTTEGLCKSVLLRIGVTPTQIQQYLDRATAVSKDVFPHEVRQHAARLRTPRPAVDGLFKQLPSGQPAAPSPGEAAVAGVQPEAHGHARQDVPPAPPQGCSPTGGAVKQPTGMASASARGAPCPAGESGGTAVQPMPVLQGPAPRTDARELDAGPHAEDALRRYKETSEPDAGDEEGRPGVPSGEAVTAFAVLLDACLPKQPAPNFASALQDAEEARNQQDERGQEGQPPPAVYAPYKVWYDARSRSALKQLAAWLHVPPRLLALHESHLAERCLAQVHSAGTPDAVQPTESAMERQLRYLKIGAAAVGGGALLAFTGGLAAPALGAVAGSLLTTAGAGAAAGAVTSAVGSTLGTAALVGAFGAGGGHAIGGRMAHRLGELKEFGFWELLEKHSATLRDLEEPSKDATSRDATSKVASSRDATSRDATSKDGTSKHGTSKDGTSEDAASKGSASEHGPPTGAAHVGKTGLEESKPSSTTFSWLWKGRASSTQDQEHPPEVGREVLPVPVVSVGGAEPRLAVTVAIPGWLRTPDDAMAVWDSLRPQDSTAYALIWETPELLSLNISIVNMIKDKAAQEAGKYLIENFLVHGIFGAIAAPMWVLKGAGFIDTPWRVVMNRATLVGHLLARVLMSGAHG
eukprot:jgi/Botrbrau1/20227/Bobra.31_1s0023.2